MRGPFFCLGLGLALSAWVLQGQDELPPEARLAQGGPPEAQSKGLPSLRILPKPVESYFPEVEPAPSLTEGAPIDVEMLELDEYQRVRYSRLRWNLMRRLVEQGRRPTEERVVEEVVVSTTPVRRAELPPEPGFQVRLPYESKLRVAGRKVISMKYKSTRFSNEQFARDQGIPVSQSQLDIDQQLQVQIKGTVGRKVNVNVDFDDTREDKRDISVVYTGDPDEVMQKAAFGDITLSLPQTEFVGYSKQVFGASAELKYKNAKLFMIGSRTKGTTETKRFTGNVTLQKQDILDTAYIRRRFYNVTKLTGANRDLPIAPSSEKIYLDNQDITRPANGFSLSSTTVDHTLLPGATSYTGNFVQLVPGQDYTIDYTRGVITFRRTLATRDVVAVDYIAAGESQPISQTRGQAGRVKLLKFDETQSQGVPQTEELTHYSIGVTKIVRDNGQGNFFLKILDLNRNEVGSALSVAYPTNIFVDFEAGTFFLDGVRFDTTRTAFSDIYNPTPTHRLIIFLEYRARVKTYLLRPNLVVHSERIVMNGRVLKKDVDYFIDYETGFVTFFREDEITESSVIDATYEFSPFGIAGAQQDTLVGERVELGLGRALPTSAVGSTVLYQFAAKPASAPNIRQTSGNFLLTEADLHLRDLAYGNLPFKTSFAAEVARSSRNPNTFGKAIVDNMEGIKDDSSVATQRLRWQPGSNPTGVRAFASAFSLSNEDVRILDINPKASALSSDKTQVLAINYDLSQSTEASIVTPLSNTGLDFSKKLFLELQIQGDGSATGSSPSRTTLNVRLGQIDEDADGQSRAGGNTIPKTEDKNLNGLLDSGEDGGWSHINPDGTTTAVGTSNNQLDSEDLDSNGKLDIDNGTGGNYGYVNAAQPLVDITDNQSTTNRVDFSGWHFFRIPLNVAANGGALNWTTVKQVRLSLQAGSGSTKTGTLRIAKIAVVGNRWEADSVASSTLTVRAINSEDDPNYVSLVGNPVWESLNQTSDSLGTISSGKKRDQALALNFTLPANSTASAKNVFASPMDFSKYETIRLFVYGDAKGETFFLRAGSDSDFLEFSIPVTWNGWRLLTLKQTDVTGDQKPDTWESSEPDGATRRSGNPNFTNVSQLRVGIINTSGAALSGEIWVNEIHVDDAITRAGLAKRVGADVSWDRWGTFGGAFKEIDKNFETFTSAITNQDRREESLYANVTRLAVLPLAFKYSRTLTITPSTLDTSNPSLVSVLQEGRVDTRNLSASGTLQLPRMPRLGFGYDRTRTLSSEIFRTDTAQAYTATLDHAFAQPRLFLSHYSLGLKHTRQLLDFGPEVQRTTTDLFGVSDTRDFTNDLSAKLHFDVGKRISLDPSYSLSRATEEKDLLVDTATLTTTNLDYNKLRAQTIGLGTSVHVFRWLKPGARYTITTRETNGIPTSSNSRAFDLKTIDRTSSGELNWDLDFRNLTSARPLQSLALANAYSIEDGDTWEKVEAGFNSLKILTVRTPLRPGATDAFRRQLTLRDTFRSTDRWSPFDWTSPVGVLRPFKTLGITSTFTDTKQRSETTGTTSRTLTRIFPDLIFTFTETEHFFGASPTMSNSQLNLKYQRKKVDVENATLTRGATEGTDWRFTLWRKLDLFFSYNETRENVLDRILQLTSRESKTTSYGTQLGFWIGRFRFVPKYDQTVQLATDSEGRLTTDLTTRIPALQVFGDLAIPAGLRLPLGGILKFSNRIRWTTHLSLTQRRSSLNVVRDNTDAYAVNTSADYEVNENIRVLFGGGYTLTLNKENSAANFSSFEINSQLTIQF